MGRGRAVRAAAVVGLLLLAGCSPQEPQARPDPPAATDADDPRAAVVLAPDVLAYDEEEGYSYETFVVSWSDPDVRPDRVVRSLRRTADRFLRVDERGVEHPDDDAAEQAYDEGYYTPNYVSEPERRGDSVQLYVDCKGVIPERMETTLRRILREELESLGYRLRVSAVVHG